MDKIKIIEKNMSEIDNRRLFWINNISDNMTNENGMAVMKGKRVYSYFTVTDNHTYINVTIRIFHFFNNAMLIKKICNYIFEKWCSCEKIVIFLLENDRFGCRLFQTAGFLKEVVLREHYNIGGLKVNCIIYSKFR